jgi:tripartite-type tricarboxylate transporter receptor subunit TctC
MSRWFAALAFSFILSVAPAPASNTAWAQDAYPTKPVKFLVPYPAGGTNDVLARIVGDKLQAKWGQPVIIENRSGGSGNIGAALVAQAEPDGYTLLVSATPPIATNQSLYKNLSYKADDFVPITNFGSVPNLVMVRKGLPVNSVGELIAHAKANPGKLTYGSAGIGSTLHLAAEFFKRAAGVDILHVPYKGAAQATTDLVGGQVQMMFGPLVAIMPLAEAGKIRALAVTSPQRSALAPNVPTMIESGIAGFEVTGWYGLAAPAGTPKAAIDKLNAETNHALKSPELIEQFRLQGYEPLGGTPDEMNTQIKTDVERWTKIIRDAGIQPQ